MFIKAFSLIKLWSLFSLSAWPQGVHNFIWEMLCSLAIKDLCYLQHACVCVCGFVVFRIQIQKKDYWNRKLKRESNFTPKYNPHLSPYNFLFVLNLPPLCSAWLAILLHYLCLLHTSTYIIMIRSNCRQRWQLLDPKKSAVCKCFIMKVCKPRVQMTPPAKMLNRLPLSFKKFLIYRRRATSSEE